ncbi:hypothetical protein L1987_27863 [Smallanthus sonchifolius]|uniref:Uncharacterized protein n=1 Tax=Smallanthus sonchifolius TaxID=185202 RepID=A0ACB9IDJ6_9ASTR|nr:hypothetical protein L1987_27863 [Smallanthus sonchifolius]
MFTTSSPSPSPSFQKLSLKPNSVGMRVPSRPCHLKVVDNRRSIRVFALFGGERRTMKRMMERQGTCCD